MRIERCGPSIRSQRMENGTLCHAADLPSKGAHYGKANLTRTKARPGASRWGAGLRGTLRGQKDREVQERREASHENGRPKSQEGRARAWKVTPNAKRPRPKGEAGAVSQHA